MCYVDVNVLLIVVDALRADALGCYGSPKKITRNLDKLARKGVLFEEAYSCSNTTDPSLTSIFSGKYPRSHGIINHGGRVTREEVACFNRNRTVLLSEILKQRNYVTLSVDWLGRWHKRGFDSYIRASRQKPSFQAWLRDFMRQHFHFLSTLNSRIRKIRKLPKKIPYDDAREVTDLAIRLIEQNKQKTFFLFVHYWDTHTPYNSPGDIAAQFQKKTSSTPTVDEILNSMPKHSNLRKRLSAMIGDKATTDQIIATYFSAVKFVDSQIGRLISRLRSLSILNRTLIIITSDHGESLTEHGIFFDHHGLYDVSLHVPLIFYSPHFSRSIIVEALVQHVDILPTILDVLEISESTLSFDGRSMLPLISGEKTSIRSSIYAEETYTETKMAVRTKDFKYIEGPSEEKAVCRYCNIIHGGVEELYNLNKDPEETQNLVQEEVDLKREMQRRLNEWNRYFQETLEKTRIKAKISKLKTAKII